MSRSTARYRQARNPRYGQISMEFMLLFMLFMVAVAIAVIVSTYRSYEISQAQIDLSANDILDRAAGRINNAFLEGDGFSTTVRLPESILMMNYTIDIESNEVILYLEGRTYIAYLLTSNITGDIAKGTNLISNVDGEIVITEET